MHLGALALGRDQAPRAARPTVVSRLPSLPTRSRQANGTPLGASHILAEYLLTCPSSGAAAAAAAAERECSVEGWRRPLGGSARTQPAVPMVALGKFDAMHRGHQALAAAAARLGGTPWLVSFAGMADVLGWPSRLPLVAPCDRRRVLETWTGGCGGATPAECAIPFAEVRTLSPEEFVRLLAEELRVGGVAVGSNFRQGRQ